MYNPDPELSDPKKASVVAAVVLLVAAAGYAGFQQHTNHPATPLTQAQHRIEEGSGKTIGQWTTEIEQSPENPELYFSRGELYSRRNESKKAVNDYTEAIKLKPAFIDAYKSRALMYVANAQYDEALVDADKVKALVPDSAEGYETRAFVYGAREQYAEAIEDWKHAITFEEKEIFYRNLAACELNLAHYSEADRAALRAVALHDDCSSRALSGLIYTFQQKYDLAYKQLKLATENADARGTEWQQLAYYYTCIGKRAEGQHAIVQAKILENSPARASRLAGEYYRCEGDYEKALLLNAPKKMDEDPLDYRERAVTYISLGEWRSAYDDLKKSLELNPFSATTLSFLALTESQLGMKAEAQERINKAVQSKAVAPIVLVNRAKIEMANGDKNKALDFANQAITADPFLKEGFEARSEIRQKLADTAGAVADASKAKRLFSHLII